jgi:hypothetical protein
MVLPPFSCYFISEDGGVLYGAHATESDIDAVIFNPVASTSQNVRRSNLRWVQYFHQSMQVHEMYAARPSQDEYLLKRPFLFKKNRAVEI